MMSFVIILSIFTASFVRAEPDALASDPRAEEELDGRSEETFETEAKTFKLSKKGLAYLITGLVLKALVFIKVALAKLAILGNISIMISKLSLVLSLLLTFGKYFGGISKMLKLKTIGYEGQPYGYYSGLENHGNYLT